MLSFFFAWVTNGLQNFLLTVSILVIILLKIEYKILSYSKITLNCLRIPSQTRNQMHRFLLSGLNV